MSFFDRLKKLEDHFAEIAPWLDARHAQNRLMAEFSAADPANAELVNRCAEICGSANAIAMIKHRDCRINRPLADFCREKRYRFPGASLVRCYHGNNVIMIGGNGKLMQIMAHKPAPTTEVSK
jgi:hypothetical protein